MAINRKLLAIAMRGLQQMPDHPGLVRPIAFDFDNSPYYCAMPLLGFKSADGKGAQHWETPTLESCCGKVPPDEAWRYIYEICDAMAWLHRHNLLHCNLKPRNVLVEDDQASSTKISDPVQGWIGGVHHFDTTDHFMYLPPEQAEHPDALASHGTEWDVYAFGVLAFRLLTGQFPRGAEAFADQLKRQSQARGTICAVDNGVVLQAVRAQPEVVWPSSPTSKWDGRRKQIIEKCLALDVKSRWPDLREVMREFEKLEADFQLEDAREKIELEKRRQARRVFLLRTSAIVLGVALVNAAAYGIWYGLTTHRRAVNAETTVEAKEKARKEEVAAREMRIAALQTKLTEVHEEKRLADANLQMSQEAVDQFLTQLLQMPTGVGLEAEISAKQLGDALSFYEAERARLKDSDDLLPERARNYFNTAQLLLRKQQRVEAGEFLERAKSALTLLLQKQPGHSDTPRRQALLGRSCRWLGTLKADDGRRSDALALFKQAVDALDPAVTGDPANRATRYECASAWYEYGRRARRDAKVKDAAAALAKVSAVMDAKAAGGELTSQEQFLLARSRIEEGLAQRDLGNTDQAMKTIFDALEEMVKLVEKSNRNPEQAITLAEAYIEFGDLIAGKLGSNDAKDAHVEAMNILIELVRVHPQWGEARHLMGRNYGAMAALERDLGNASEAQRRLGMAVQALNELVKIYPDNTLYVSETARVKSQQAQLLCDLGKTKDAIPLAEGAASSVEEIMKKNDATLDELDRKGCGVLLAQLYGVLGHAGEVSRNSKLAKTSFNKASEQWQKLKARHGEDEVITQGLNWTKDRLARLH